MIRFNKPAIVGNEIKYIQDAIEKQRLAGNNEYTKKCQALLDDFGCKKSLLTTSCTAALEMSAILLNINPGDEVIMPSFTFVSTANAFILQRAKIVFVDIRPDTMNMDENLIEDAITEKTKAIVPVHYAGVSCEMDKILEIAQKYNLFVVEDAAQGVMAKYRNKFLGTIGDIGCYSFHETKNYNCGEGGAILLNDEKWIERAEIIWEKGTNRTKFFRGEIDKYTWVDIGSSYLPSELNAAYLLAQLEQRNKIKKNRLKSWNLYYEKLKKIQNNGLIELPFIPDHCEQNGHLFYIKVKNLEERTNLLNFLRQKGIKAVFHYIPLHSSPAGERFSRFHGEDKFTTRESERLVRLPLFYDLQPNQIEYIADCIYKFYGV
jgi:dTDP-4-amino-4,6-dideoxygalactose transaminase